MNIIETFFDDKLVAKRDGSIVPFDGSKIGDAIEACFKNSKPTGENTAVDIQWEVEAYLAGECPNQLVFPVEQIQDAVIYMLGQLGEIEVQSDYQAYRQRHAEEREKRPIPPEVKALFETSQQYFPTPLQEFQFYDKYSRFDWDEGRRETWVETVDRAVDFLVELSKGLLPSHLYHEIRQAVLKMEVMPSMRLLAMAGNAARRNNICIYNCFSGDTQFVTSQGIHTLKDKYGKPVEVLDLNGNWRPATVEYFGEQSVYDVTLGHWNGGKHGNAKHTVRVTANHRWILADGSETTSLQVGDKLYAPVLTIPEEYMNLEAVQHGFVYGDGTITRNGNREYAQVRLCGEKAGLLETVFSGYTYSYPPSCNGEPVVYLGKSAVTWKQVPHRTEPDYVAGFIYGLTLADGYVNPSSGNIRIDTQNQELVEWINQNAAIAGYKVLAHRVYNTPTNYGERTNPLHQMVLGTGEKAMFRVESIQYAGIEPVYCVVEPDTHTFTLANGQVTGNCSYMKVDSLAAFVEAMIISMNGCGVGYSVEKENVEKLPRVQKQSGMPPIHFTVPDTAEGWAEALRLGLTYWFSGEDVIFNLSEIRKAGAPLKTKGGRASGPEPLRKMLKSIRKIILSAQGRRLKPIEAHDIMCHVGNASIAGGVRRTALISLFSWDDEEMLNAKAPGFDVENNQRWNANNSIVWPDEGLKREQLDWQFGKMFEHGSGEPGIFNRAAARRLAPDRRRKELIDGTNPCGEIVLRSQQFCNLSAVVARPDDTPETLLKKVELATIIGTIQSMATNFPGLRPEWKQNCEEERLLGVDITGQMDCPEVWKPAVLTALREKAVETNRQYAQILGINQSAAVTCVKPSGNTSTLVNCSSGLHARYARYYKRRVRVNAESPVLKVLRDAGVPLEPENGQTEENATAWLATFPVKAPAETVIRDELDVIGQCNIWKRNKLFWTEHNPSVSIYYEPEEQQALVNWVWENKDIIGGMAFFPRSHDDAKLYKLPYEEITEEEYRHLLAAFPEEIDWSKLYRYETDDRTEAAQVLACVAAGGDC